MLPWSRLHYTLRIAPVTLDNAPVTIDVINAASPDITHWHGPMRAESPLQTVPVDFLADNPGRTLLHCHQQLHIDYSFMQIIQYAAS